MIDLDEYAAGVRAGDTSWVARAITLVESRRPDRAAAAEQLLTRLGPYAGGARRVGVTGVPGAGKSTFIDALGSRLTAAGHRVAVLALDPSSTRTGGSVLGDRTRMTRLAAEPRAFVRPSPTAGALGGVARATREAMVVVEAAGFDVVLVETVGVGQSETEVATMVDTVLLLSLARTGDQLQGIKRGVLELADVVAVNKADGSHLAAARQAARELTGALGMLPLPPGGRRTPVLVCSGQDGAGVDEVWQAVTGHADGLAGCGELAARRRRQQVAWMWALVRDSLMDRARARPEAAGLAAGVADGTVTPTAAARFLTH